MEQPKRPHSPTTPMNTTTIVLSLLAAIAALILIAAFILRRLKGVPVEQATGQPSRPQAGNQVLPVLCSEVLSDTPPHQQGVHQPKHQSSCRCRNAGGGGQERLAAIDTANSDALSLLFCKRVVITNSNNTIGQVLTSIYISQYGINGNPTILMYGDRKPEFRELWTAVMEYETAGQAA